MIDYRHGRSFFILLLIVIIIERFMQKYLTFFGRIAIYGFLLVILVRYFEWIYKNSKNMKRDSTLQTYDYLSFQSLMLPLVFTTGILLIASAIGFYLESNTEVAITLAVFGLLYIPLGYFLGKTKSFL